jgi:quercetin dioxygenase-like cupin family protein
LVEVINRIHALFYIISKTSIEHHWCERGHVLYVLEGELLTELKDGRKFILRAGMSYQVSSGMEPHRSSTETGAKLFIVD